MHHAQHVFLLMNRAWLADVINWVGVVTGMVGAFVTGRDGFKELLRWAACLVPLKVRVWLRRLLGREPQTQSVSAALAAAPTISLSSLVFGNVDQSASVEEQVPQLARAVSLLTSAVTFIANDAAERDRKTRELADRADKELSRLYVELRERMNAADRANAKFNARGLPLVAMGTLMTGPTSILAEWIAFGWFLVAVAIGMLVFGLWPWRLAKAPPATG